MSWWAGQVHQDQPARVDEEERKTQGIMRELPMDKVLVEVFGPEPPCARCLTTLRNANQAAANLKDEGVEVTVNKLNIASREVVSKYGVLLSPALAVNSRVRVAGRIPNPDEIVRIIKGSV